MQASILLSNPPATVGEHMTSSPHTIGPYATLGEAHRLMRQRDSPSAGGAGPGHRKVLLIDERVAFVGGINIGDEYAAHEDDGGWAAWR